MSSEYHYDAKSLKALRDMEQRDSDFRVQLKEAQKPLKGVIWGAIITAVAILGAVVGLAAFLK
jgi:hypothetical protein